MSKHKCTNCNKEYKYASYLQRHNQNKKGCNINNISIINPTIENNQIPTVENNQIPTIENNQIQNDMFSIFNIYDIFKKFINITKQNDKEKEYFELLDKYIKDNNLNQNNQTLDNSINTEINNNENKYNCDNCNNNFTTRQAFYKHNKFGRCKGNTNNDSNIIEENEDRARARTSGVTLNDIMNSNILDSNNTTNNNTTNNNSNNTTINGDNIINNITINVNSFGCESLQHISIQDFSSLFNNFDHLNTILYKLSNLIYINNINNMNFTKYNMNKNIVTYLTKDMKFKTLSEREFIKEFEINIKKLCIELFYIHKNNLSLEELIYCMKSLLLYYEMLSDTKKKINRIGLNEQLKSIMDCVFRHEEIKVILKKVEKDLLNNPKLKNNGLKTNVNRIQEQNIRLDDYNFTPKEDNTDEKNLNRIKNKANADNLADAKKYGKM